MLYQLSYSRGRRDGVESCGTAFSAAASLRGLLPDTAPDRLSVPGSGGEGDRTPDLVNAIHALSQLSYAPVAGPGAGFRQELLSLTGYKW